MKMRLLIVTLLFSYQSFADDSLSYTGRLVNANGSPVTGPVNLKIELAYTDPGAPGVTAPHCTTNMNGVPLSNGVFHLKIKFDTGTNECGLAGKTLTQVLAEAPAGETVAIRVTDLTPTPDKVYSYQAIHSLPYSVIAKNLSQMGAATGEVLAWDGTKWTPSVAGIGVAVTSVATGAGLTGGPITTTGTISIVDGGVTAAKLHQMGAAATNVLKWNGAAWAPAADTGIITETDPTVQGFAKVAPAVCLNNQTLKFDALLNTGAGGVFCQTIAIGSDAVTEGVTNLYFTSARAKTATVADAITNGVTDVAPSQNAVFDALAADVARTKIATGTADHVLINDGSGVLSSVATLPASKGGIGLTSSAAFKMLTTDATGAYQQVSCAPGEILLFNGAAALTCTAHVSGIASINIGTGLTPAGAFTSGGTIAIANSGVDTTQIADSAVTNIKVAAAAAIARTKLASGTANRILINDGTGVMSEVAAVPLTMGGTGLSSATPGANLVLGVNNANTASEYKSIAQGTGVSVGHTANTITVGVATGGIDTTQLADNAVTNIKVAAAAAIARTKLANGTADHVLINDGSGVMSSVATLPTSKGGLGLSSSAAYKMLTTDATGAYQQVSCAPGEVLSFNGAAALTCITPTTSANTFVQNGNSFGAAAVLGTNDANSLAFETNSIARMTILSDGSVGIGTAASLGSHKLSIDSGGSGALYLKTASSNAQITLDDTGANDVYLTSSLGFFDIWTGGNNRRLTVSTNGNVGIGNTDPKGILDIASTTSGILIPRMTTAERNLISVVPAPTGMQIYNTTTNALNFYDGDSWEPIVSGTPGGIASINIGTGLTPAGAFTSGGTIAIANSGVDTTQIADSAVTNIKVAAAAAIARTKLASGTANRILTNDGSGVMSEVASVPLTMGGTGLTSATPGANLVLGVNNANTASEYKSIAQGTGVSVAHTANTITVGVATGGIDTTQLADNAVTNIKVAAAAAIARTKLANGTADHVLINDGSGVMSSVATLPVTKGGLGLSSSTAYKMLTTDATGAYQQVNCSAGEILMFNGAANLACIVPGTSANAFFQNGNNFGAAAVLGTNDAHSLSFETNNATHMTILSTGNVGIGTSAPGSGLIALPEYKLHIRASDTAVSDLAVALEQSTDTAASNPAIYAFRSRGIASGKTVVQSADPMFQIVGAGYDGSNYIQSGRIDFEVDGTPGVNDMPGRIVFKTTADGAAGATERMRIDNAGNVGISTDTPDSKLDINGALSMRNMAAPAVAPAGQGRIYYDTGSNTFKVSQNGVAYANLVGATVADATTGSKGIMQVGTGLSVSSGTVSANFGAAGGTVTQGNDSRLSDSRAPSGSAGGDLTGTYPSPTLNTSGVTIGTYSKVTVDAKGRVTVGASIVAADVPSLDASKINNGTFDAARIPSGTDATKLPLLGGTMAGAINMNNNNLNNLPTPVTGSQAATKDYVDAAGSGSAGAPGPHCYYNYPLGTACASGFTAAPGANYTGAIQHGICCSAASGGNGSGEAGVDGVLVMSSATFTGNLGGRAGANAKCLTELTNTNWLGKSFYTINSSNVKAFLCDSTGCNDLLPSTKYYYTHAATLIGGTTMTTDGFGRGPGHNENWTLSFPNGGTYWSGRSGGGATTWGLDSSGASCTNWSTTGGTGGSGTTNTTSTGRWYQNNDNCAASLQLLCFVNP